MKCIGTIVECPIHIAYKPHIVFYGGGRGGVLYEVLVVKTIVNDGVSSHRPWIKAKQEFMAYFVIFLGISFVLAALAVASNPSPYYGVVGLVLGSVVGCG